MLSLERRNQIISDKMEDQRYKGFLQNYEFEEFHIRKGGREVYGRVLDLIKKNVFKNTVEGDDFGSEFNAGNSGVFPFKKNKEGEIEYFLSVAKLPRKTELVLYVNKKQHFETKRNELEKLLGIRLK